MCAVHRVGVAFATDSGQRLYPVIEFDNGHVYRAESKDMAAVIRAGQLLDEAHAAARFRLPEQGAVAPGPTRYRSVLLPYSWSS